MSEHLNRQRLERRLAEPAGLVIKPILVILVIGWAFLTDGMGELPITRKEWKYLGVFLALSLMRDPKILNS